MTLAYKVRPSKMVRMQRAWSVGLDRGCHDVTGGGVCAFVIRVGESKNLVFLLGRKRADGIYPSIHVGSFVLRDAVGLLATWVLYRIMG